MYCRFPIRHVKTITPNVEGSIFTCQQYAFTLHEVTFDLFNVHLRPPVPLKGAGGPFSMLDTSPIRLEEIKLILDHVQHSHFIVAGDMNENDGMEALAHLVLERNLNDCLMLTDKTTHWWKFLQSSFGAYVIQKRLDHVVCSSNLLPVACSVSDDDQDGSDHYLVVGEMEIR